MVYGLRPRSGSVRLDPYTRWGSVDPSRLGMGCSLAMGVVASHRFGLLCVGCRF